MSKRLSDAVIRERMVEWRNLKRLHKEARKRIAKQDIIIKEQAVRIVFLETTVAEQAATIETFKLQIEELRTMVFGRKRKKKDEDDLDTPPARRVPRTPDSYKRPLPKESEVTGIKDHPIDACAHCGRDFADRDFVPYFEEDIPLPQKKIVIKHVIEKGYCATCRKWSVGAPPPAAPIILGGNMKRYVTYLSVVCRQSYAQIQDVLLHTYDFRVSQGEIAKILEKEGNARRPEYERLKAKIRGEPSVHLDETGWKLFIRDGYRRYAWTMVGGASAESAFVLGKTRGKGNATDLLGDSKAVVVSDDYAAYRTLPNPHQLCLAHILRKLRDLASSGEIVGAIHDRCVLAYGTFAGIYADIEEARTSPEPVASHTALLERLQTFSILHSNDPAKLVRIKKQVSERAANYLTCLLHPAVASDNNAAERSLRHLVLKRKISFGSLSEKTADTLAILLSVLLSYKQRGALRGYLMGV